MSMMLLIVRVVGVRRSRAVSSIRVLRTVARGARV